MNILEINPADFGGGIAHVAASQLYEFLLHDQAEGAAAPTWFGNASDSVEDDVLAMARYINGFEMSGERLWRWGQIEGVFDTGLTSYEDLPLPRRMAFEIFADVCATAHHRLASAQDLQRKADASAIAAENVPGLKLEDSIFEPHGSLGEIEPHQQQYLKDQQQADAAALAAAEAKANEPEEHDAFSAGAPIDEENEPGKPASMSAGTQEGSTDETETADQGQAAGGAPAPDPDAQGNVAGLSDDDGEADAGADGASPTSTGEVADPVAKPAGDEGGSGAAATDPEEPAEPVKASTKSSKTKKTKSPN
ncbi:hypothetical protein ACRQ1B_06135 [Rhizobium panacihumi]|uniref:hypothetical protein n=1 Tax=Rhizobium panacihumi TaxID=2008450 RepID=UPI003D7B27CF